MTTAPNQSVTFRGYSDDIVIVEGNGFRDELYPGRDEKLFIACSDGTLLKVEYDSEGVWRFNRLAAGSANYTKTEDNGDGTDFVNLLGPINWVLGGSQRVEPRPARP